MSRTLNLPSLGENIQSATVAGVTMTVGQMLSAGDTVLELETDKAVVEVPAPSGGRVAQVLVQQGDTVSVGQPYAEIDNAEGDDAADRSPQSPTDAVEPEASDTRGGVNGETAAEAEDAPTPSDPDAQTETQACPAPSVRRTTGSRPESDHSASAKTTPANARVAEGTQASPLAVHRHVPAAPSVRRFARECGLDVDTVQGRGPHGRVSVEDVKRHLRERFSGAQGAAAMPLSPLPDFSRWGTVRRERMSAIRLATARQVSASWQRVPRVTHFDEADITQIETLRRRYADRAAVQGGKLTMAVMVVKVVAAALRKFPALNASIDMGAREIVYKDYVNIGIAVATDRGLMVPVLRDADRKNMIELAVEIDAVAKKCREGRIQPDELQGGTFTVTNLGAIGGSFFTPIVNVPEVAILGMGRAAEHPRLREGKLEAVTLLPLSLSYDHRLIDGADAARFTRWIAEAIAEPLVLSLEGPS